MSPDPPSFSSLYAPSRAASRAFQVRLTGGHQVSVQVPGTDLDDVAFRLARDRFLIGSLDIEVDGFSVRKGILIPVNRIDYVIDVDD